jgi:transposase
LWSVVHQPTPEDEDARRMHRELAQLTRERTSHANRISSLLVLHNLRPHIIIRGRDWAAWWERHGTQVPPVLRAEIERESARLALVKQQVKAMEAKRRQDLADGKQPLVAQLAQLRAIGPNGAWVLVKELFGWRRFANRRELAGCLGLVPTPRQPDRTRHQQGRQQASARVAGRARLVLAAPATAKRLDPVVQPALRRRWQANATRGHRGPGQETGDHLVAVSAVRRDPGRGLAQAGRRNVTVSKEGALR